MKQLRITIITFAWPPRNSIGAHRPYSWAKYWSQSGAAIKVLTAKKYFYDAPLDLHLPPIPNVQVDEVDYRPLSNNLSTRRLIPLLRVFAISCYRILRKYGLPIENPRESWFRAIKQRITDLSHECDIVVSTYDPKTVHLIASEMKQENPKLFWAADFRDLWSQNHAVFWSEKQRLKERAEELATIKHADLITSVSPELCAELAHLHSQPSISITNGFDLDQTALHKNLSREFTPGPTLTLVYTGKIYPGLRDPLPLIHAIAHLEDTRQIEKKSIELHIYGGQDDNVIQLLSSFADKHFIFYHGHVSYEVALSAQKAADLLILLESPNQAALGVLTGKIFEYISSGTPILSIGSSHASAISRILSSTKTGVCAQEDEATICNILLKLKNGQRPSWFSPKRDEIMSYSRKRQAQLMLDTIRSSYFARFSSVS